MIVNGTVEMVVTLNVYDLETDSVYETTNGRIVIEDADQFFADWIEGWVEGTGELLSSYDKNTDLEREEDWDWEEDEDEEEEEYDN